MKTRKGISLIVLVITIIVIIILAGAVILSLASNNPIAGATEATFKQNVSTYDSELLIALSNEYLNDYSFRPETFNKGTWNGGEIENTIKQYIPSITKNDGQKFKIQGGALIYVGADETEQDWLINMGILSEDIASTEEIVVGVIATINKTFSGATTGYSYDNPVIPAGFVAVNTTIASWNNLATDWNKGLVIQDENGNQFVWVPVNGSTVTYEKWCTTNIVWFDSSIGDDSITGIENESAQVSTYGGFYIARFQAGNQSGILASKRNTTVWTDITYGDSKALAEAMYNTEKVKSGLVTGTQWDTVMKWINNSGLSVIDSRAWGNYNNSISPANVLGYGSKQVTGYSESWKAKNIYDLAGNTWEWTNEIYSSYRINRGGVNFASGIDYPAACRGSNTVTGTSSDLSFRVVLYIL